MSILSEAMAKAMKEDRVAEIETALAIPEVAEALKVIQAAGIPARIVYACMNELNKTDKKQRKANYHVNGIT